MKERNFDDMIAYFNRRVSEMDIAQDYKMELLGMVTALGYKHEKTAQQWIPCSERLPEDEDYLETFMVTIQCEHVDGWDDYVTGYAVWTPHGWDIESHYIGQIKAIAWMPLPEPHKERQEE